MTQNISLPLFPDLIPLEESPKILTGVCEQIQYFDLRSGFSIAIIRTPQGNRETILGKGDPFSPGDTIEADGVFEKNARGLGGRQFKAKFIRARIPETTEGIRAYLSTGVITGVSAKSAERLVQAYGDTLPSIMGSPAALMAAGITELRASLIAEHWITRTRHGSLLTFLHSLHLGPATAKKLIDTYRDDVYRIILTDPYRIAREVHGIGFLTADRIALSQGMKKDAPERIKAAILHICGEIEREGHCAISRMALLVKTAKDLIIADRNIELGIDGLLVQGDLIEETIGGRPVLFRRFMRDAEKDVAEEITARMEKLPEIPNILNIIEQITKNIGLPPLHENQVRAVVASLSSRVSIITGNPGTGKTSTLTVLLGVLRHQIPDIRILLTAPTGRAAQRMYEQTGVSATTVHRLLAWSPEGRKFTKNQENPLEADVLIVDESSMLDLLLFRDLLHALPRHARLILVGDADQLPSVGAGDVLADLIASNVFPVSRLTHIFRQGAGSEIARESQRINRGNPPHLKPPRSGLDLWGVYKEDPASIAHEIVRLVKETIPREGLDPMRDIQVLAPGHKSETGVQNLNILLQEALNPYQIDRPELITKDRTFRLGDRVIQTTNNYDLEVFNGDIGFIVSIGSTHLEVDFEDRIIKFSGGSINDLHLAYAITIHKSQGSEFRAVVMAISTQHFMMLRRNLLYTGVSRARELCCVVGQQKALGIAARKGSTGRLTGLKSRITSAFLMASQPNQA